ncbi:MAG: fimbrial biogenesis chaperone [Erythrobacter sp.]
MSFNNFKKFATTGATALAMTLAALPAIAQAQGDLLVAPTRVILDGSRGTEVILSNIGSDEATYRIGLELRRMGPDGRLEPVEKIDANDTEEAALGMIRYAPRRITLPPGQPQAVRLAARPGADLADGEYRVHMSFKAIPRPREATSEAEPAQGVSIQLIPIYGVTIPIIVRHGRVEAQVGINQPQIVEGEDGPELSIMLSRAGDSSTYGDLVVTRPGRDEPLMNLRGVAVYPEVQNREVRVRLTPEQAAGFRGQVRVEYRETVEAGGGLIAAVDGFVS